MPTCWAKREVLTCWVKREVLTFWVKREVLTCWAKRDVLTSWAKRDVLTCWAKREVLTVSKDLGAIKVFAKANKSNFFATLQLTATYWRDTCSPAPTSPTRGQTRSITPVHIVNLPQGTRLTIAADGNLRPTRCSSQKSVY